MRRRFTSAAAVTAIAGTTLLGLPSSAAYAESSSGVVTASLSAYHKHGERPAPVTLIAVAPAGMTWHGVPTGCLLDGQQVRCTHVTKSVGFYASAAKPVSLEGASVVGVEDGSPQRAQFDCATGECRPADAMATTLDVEFTERTWAWWQTWEGLVEALLVAFIVMVLVVGCFVL